jgi:hypothetical protein
MKKLFYTFSYFLCYFVSIAQFDSPKPNKEKTYLVGGLCNTLSNNSSSQPFFSPGVNLSINHCSIISENFMLQIGLEYDNTKYFIAQFNPGFSLMSNPGPGYSNMSFNLNTFTIPLYFNLFLHYQKLFIGAGPSLSVLPDSKVSGYSGQIPITNITWLVKPIDIGVGVKVGYFLKVFRNEWIIEGKITYGFLNLIHKDGSITIANLHNNYFTLSIGYVFNK